MNPNIPREKNEKKIEDFGNLTITSFVKFKVQSIKIKQSL